MFACLYVFAGARDRFVVLDVYTVYLMALKPFLTFAKHLVVLHVRHIHAPVIELVPVVVTD